MVSNVLPELNSRDCSASKPAEKAVARQSSGSNSGIKLKEKEKKILKMHFKNGFVLLNFISTHQPLHINGWAFSREKMLLLYCLQKARRKKNFSHFQPPHHRVKISSRLNAQ